MKLLKGKKEKKSKKRKLTRGVETKLEDVFKEKKMIKTMTNFDIKECNSAKAIALKGNTDINVTSRFIDGEMLMFPKISLKSFVYDIIDVFCFPTEDVKMIYNKHDIIKCHM